MAELSQKQLDLAVEAQSAKLNEIIPDDAIASTASKATHTKWRIEGLRAAAPHLQMPWELPSAREILDCANPKLGIYAKGDYEATWDVCAAFVRLRNAAILQDTVDPRREIVSKMLRDRSLDCTFDEFADKILAALDEAK